MNAVLGEAGPGARGLKRMSHKHLSILEFMLANPEMPLYAVARHFDVSQPWLSQIVNSDIFRAALLEHSSETVTSLRVKLEALADVATERLLEKITDTTDGELIADVHKNTLRALGYGGSTRPQVNVQVNNVQYSPASPETIKEAQARWRAAGVKELSPVNGGDKDAEGADSEEYIPCTPCP